MGRSSGSGGINGRGMSAAGTGRQYSIAAPDESEEQVRVINVVENRVVSGEAYEQGTPAKKRGNKSTASQPRVVCVRR